MNRLYFFDSKRRLAHNPRGTCVNPLHRRTPHQLTPPPHSGECWWLVEFNSPPFRVHRRIRRRGGKLHGEDVVVQHGLFLKRAREGIDHFCFHYLNYISTPHRYPLYPLYPNKKTEQYVFYDVAKCNFKY